MDIRARFLGFLEEPLLSEAQELASLGSFLEATLQQARQAWPDLALEDDVFLEHLAASILRAPSKKGLQDWLDHLQAEDLWLACCCGRGDALAIQHFETRYREATRSLLYRFSGATVSQEDLQQTLREKLFVGTPGKPPKIQGFAGQGYLLNWYRVSASRLLMDATKKKAQDKQEHIVEEDVLHRLPDQMIDVELDFLKQEYQSQFKQAFEAALSELEPHERNLLRQHLIAGLSLQQIGKLQGADRSTISRKLAKARARLLHLTKQQLMQQLHISPSEYESVMALIQSRLEVSFHRLLAGPTDEPPDASRS